MNGQTSIAIELQARITSCLRAYVPVCLLLLICSGCNIFGYVGQAVGGPETKKAEFVLPKQSTAVVAEKFSNPADAVLDDEPIARFINEELRQHNLAPTIDTDAVYAMRSGQSAKWHSSTIAEVGRSLGAEQILYVNILQSEVEVAAGSEMMRGRASVTVRVVDAKTGNTLWPTGSTDGFPVNAETRLVRRGENNVYEHTMRTMLHRELATKIGMLFYDVTKE